MSSEVNQAAARAYWTQQMEQAADFMHAILDYPVEECGEPVASITDAVLKSGVKIDFAASKFAGRFDRVYWLRESLVEDVIRIGREMNQRGWVMKIEDGYRSPQVQQAGARMPVVFDAVLRSTTWENAGARPSAELLLRRLTAVVAMWPKVGTHVSATAIDISVYDMATGKELDRGAPYLAMNHVTPMASPFVSPEAQENRREISRIMERHGFIAYPYEYWHYNKGDAYVEYLAKSGKPARYGAVSIDTTTGKVTPLANPKELLTPVEEVKRLIEESLARGA